MMEKDRSEKRRKRRLSLREEGVPVIDVGFFTDISRLAVTLTNLTEREGHKQLSSVVTSDVAVTITQMRHTFDLLMFINSDERRDSDPFYRLAYSFVSLPLVRSMIDGLYNVSSMLTFPKRAHDFRLVGFKNMLAALDAEEKVYGDEPGWKEYIANERWKVRVGREAAGFSEADLAGKVRWPTLSVYLQKGPEEDDEHQSFMRRFTYGPWRQYSEISHMTGAGLHDIFAYLNVDSIPRDRRQYVLNRGEKELAMHLGRAATVLLSLVTEVQAKFRFHGHGVDERLQLVWPKVAQFPFGKELYEARYKALLNNSPKHA